MRSMRLGIVYGMLILLMSLAGGLRPVSAQTTAAQKTGTPETGYAVKKPVFGGACKTCPWGAVAEFVKAAMKPYGYDVQICYTCAGASEAARIVAAASMPPQSNRIPPDMNISSDVLRRLREQSPPPPNGPVDFGTTNPIYLWWAYQGTHDFAGEGPRKNLRLLGVIQEPYYLIVAVKADSGITDLSQIKEKHLPVRILRGVYNDSMEILAYYGITKESIEAAGGQIGMAFGNNNFDVLVGGGTLENAPEWNIWYEVSQKYDLNYLQLPDDLLKKLAKDFDMQPGTIPIGLLRGIEHPIPTVTLSGDAVYGRTDMPEDFAYAVAKAMDEQQDLLLWSTLRLSYNPRTAWKAFGVPLHPGAARYYREKGYMK